MRALRIRATRVLSATRARSMARTCVRARTASKVSTARKTLTSATPDHLASTTACASTLRDRSSATAREDSPDPGARSTSTSAIPILARTMARASMNAALSDVSACQVPSTLLNTFKTLKNGEKLWKNLGKPLKNAKFKLKQVWLPH